MLILARLVKTLAANGRLRSPADILPQIARLAAMRRIRVPR